MPTQPIVCSNVELELRAAPIKADWIIEGAPVARCAELSRSADHMATTLVWDCTPGKFNWFYDTDETIHILEGTVTLDDGHVAPRRLGPGDVVFFPKGAQVRWHVESHVRKLAYFRHALPKPVEVLARAARKARRVLRRTRGAGPGTIMSEAAAVQSPMAQTA